MNAPLQPLDRPSLLRRGWNRWASLWVGPAEETLPPSNPESPPQDSWSAPLAPFSSVAGLASPLTPLLPIPGSPEPWAVAFLQTLRDHRFSEAVQQWASLDRPSPLPRADAAAVFASLRVALSKTKTVPEPEANALRALLQALTPALVHLNERETTKDIGVSEGRSGRAFYRDLTTHLDPGFLKVVLQAAGSLDALGLEPSVACPLDPLLKSGRFDVIQVLFEHASPSQRSQAVGLDGQTTLLAALTWATDCDPASRHTGSRLALQLLEGGVDADRANRSGETPLMVAATKEDGRWVEAVLPHIHMPNAIDTNGCNALHRLALAAPGLLAASFSPDEVLRLALRWQDLVAAGVSETTPDRLGATPLDWLKRNDLETLAWSGSVDSETASLRSPRRPQGPR